MLGDLEVLGGAALGAVGLDGDGLLIEGALTVGCDLGSDLGRVGVDLGGELGRVGRDGTALGETVDERTCPLLDLPLSADLFDVRALLARIGPLKMIVNRMNVKLTTNFFFNMIHLAFWKA
ncbi:MAG: hypothetical protein ACYTFM_05350 [Planctomycetota bacterium]|jgi:hypothetical protein